MTRLGGGRKVQRSLVRRCPLVNPCGAPRRLDARAHLAGDRDRGPGVAHPPAPRSALPDFMTTRTMPTPEGGGHERDPRRRREGSAVWKTRWLSESGGAGRLPDVLAAADSATQPGCQPRSPGRKPHLFGFWRAFLATRARPAADVWSAPPGRAGPAREGKATSREQVGQRGCFRT
jgi:hypothetical protein